EGRRWDEARLKSLTGADTIAARHMRQDWFEFKPQFKLMIVGNHSPQVQSVDDALRRRLHIVPFTFKPERPDPDLPVALMAELPAIVRWCMDGYKLWREQGGLAAPETIVAATTEYFDDQDAMGQFLQECTVALDGARSAAAKICETYREWAEHNGVGPKSAKRISADLAKRGFQRYRTGAERGVEGLMLLDRGQRGQLPLPGVGD
ncbi:MAG: phage/plasmid primase, P4 family, partial [Gammaproteobacteria bacterium]|nr:phage/plasmid primase, P4 family [Gammaproteobacteria bacterium]